MSGTDTARMREAIEGALLRYSFGGWVTSSATVGDVARTLLPVVQRLTVEKAAEVGSGVWIDPARRSGEPCCGGTRLPVEMVIEAVWARGVDAAMDTYCVTRAQVLHACWYAGAGNVVRLHGKNGAYVARRGPWRKRWGAWAKQVHGDLWKSDSEGVIPDPPSRADALATAAQPTDGRTGE